MVEIWNEEKKYYIRQKGSRFLGVIGFEIKEVTSFIVRLAKKIIKKEKLDYCPCCGADLPDRHPLFGKV